VCSNHTGVDSSVFFCCFCFWIVGKKYEDWGLLGGVAGGEKFGKTWLFYHDVMTGAFFLDGCADCWFFDILARGLEGYDWRCCDDDWKSKVI
jgi:hypothetical protein